MHNKHKLAVALGLLALLGTVEMAHARLKIFRGTRGQVADACNGPSRTFSFGQDFDGTGWAMCIDSARGTQVICDDRESCIGIYAATPKPTPKPRKPSRSFDPPESLSEPSSGSMDPPIDAPAPDPVTDTGVIN